MPGSFLEKLYYSLPSVAQHAAFTGYGLILRSRRYNKCFRRALESLSRSEWWDPNKIEAYQDEKVRWIVRHAYHTVPFYRRWYDSKSVDIEAIQGVADLHLLPVLTKELVRENQGALISRDYARRPLIKVLTSGTTGTPLEIRFTKETLAFQWAVWWRHKGRFGLRPDDWHLVVGARVPVSQAVTRPPFWRIDWANRRSYLSSYHLSSENIDSIGNYLNSSEFKFFTGYPSALFTLANVMREQNLRLSRRPKYIVTGSDALLGHQRSTLEEVFGAPVTEQYGMAEFAGNMANCEAGRFHVDFECCYLEKSDEAGAEPEPVRFTGWGNPAMPFIRYEVGDLYRSADTPCSCGRHSHGVESIAGRREDYIITPDGRQITGLNQVFEYATNAREIQLYQPDPGRVEFRIVPNSQFGDGDYDALVREFRRRVGEGIRLDFRFVKEIERGANGKFKAVVSDVSP